MGETNLQRNAQVKIRARGGWVIKTHGNAYTGSGTPDLLICYRGRFLAPETKYGVNSPEPLQDHKMKQIREAGGISAPAWGVETIMDMMDDVDRELEQIQIALDYLEQYEQGNSP